MRRPGAPLLLGLSLAILGVSSTADAYERQWHVGGGLGYALLLNGGAIPTESSSLHGLGADLHLTYGLNDTFNLLLQVDGSIAPGPTPVVLAGGSAGAAYVIDVLRWVPWVGLMAGGYAVSALDPCSSADSPCTTFRLGVTLPFGLDYQVTRSFTLGATGHYGLLLLGPEGNVDQRIGGFLRAEYVFGY